MVKSINTLEFSACLEVTLEHPLKEFGDTSMFVMKFDHNKYLFSIPVHNWTYLKHENESINLRTAPSSYRYSQYQKDLIETMQKAIYAIDQPTLS